MSLFKGEKPDLGQLIVNSLAVNIEATYYAHGSPATTNFFIAGRPYMVVAVREIHGTAGTDGSAVTIDCTKDTGTTGPGAGTSLLLTTFNAKSTASTLVDKTGSLLAASPSTLILAKGDRLGILYTGTLTALADIVLTVALQPI